MPAKLRRHAAPATLLSVAVILTLAVAAVALSGAEAASKRPRCGETITTDTTLHHDLVNCPDNGIKIGADNVTLDLNGHVIDGDGTPAPGCNPRKEICDVGVLDTGHDGVTVMDGSVREFADSGVIVGQARHARVLDVSAVRNSGRGMLFFNCARSLVRNSSESGSSGPLGKGLALFFSHHVRVLNSSFRHNHETGVEFFDATHNLIKGNRFSRNGLAALSSAEGGNFARNQIRRNRSVRDGDGMDLAGNRNVIAGNRISHPRGLDGIGISLDAGDRNLIARNSVRDPKTTGIGVGFGRAVGNVMRRNHVRGAGKDGFHVDHKATHTLLRRNHAFGAKDDGFDVNNQKTKLTRNEARRNGDLGIEAVRGVNDGGGNVAHHNGDPRQCTHVACN
jgi:nitrous oxidase accessory protein NosD